MKPHRLAKASRWKSDWKLLRTICVDLCGEQSGGAELAWSGDGHGSVHVAGGRRGAKRKRGAPGRLKLRDATPDLDPAFRGAMETSASFEARSAPWSYPAEAGVQSPRLLGGRCDARRRTSAPIHRSQR